MLHTDLRHDEVAGTTSPSPFYAHENGDSLKPELRARLAKIPVGLIAFMLLFALMALSACAGF